MKSTKVNSVFLTLIISLFFSVNAFCQKDTLINKASNSNQPPSDVASQWNAIHNLNSIYLGGGINTFKDNPEARNFTNSDFGINLGFFKPLLKKDKFSLGLFASGSYSFANNDFGSIENPISYFDATAVTTSSQGKQSLFQFGIGPQLNIPIVRKLLFSPSVQVGYLLFNQDAIALNQEISPENQTPFTKELFKQDKVNEGGFFVKPAIKMSYAISRNWSLWAEGAYLLANTTSMQNTLIPNGSSKEGQFFSDQIISADAYSSLEKEINLNAFAVNFGLAFTFFSKKGYDHYRAQSDNASTIKPNKDNNEKPEGDAKAQDHNAARSNKTSAIKPNEDNNEKPEGDANHKTGSHTNPYFVSNEMAGEMTSANNSSSGTNSSFDASKIKEVKKESDLKGREVVLYQNGKRYYYDASKKKVRAILKSFENDNIEKATGCPPPGLSDCTFKGGFCWCYLGREKK